MLKLGSIKETDGQPRADLEPRLVLVGREVDARHPIEREDRGDHQHAHPDDEATGTGGVLARYAAEGIRSVAREVITVAREGFEVGSEAARTEVLDKSFLYLRIAQFQVDTGQDVKKALNDNLKKHTLKGVILDLRNNPGGLLDAAVGVSDHFLEKGAEVQAGGSGQGWGSHFNSERFLGTRSDEG